MNRVEGLYFVLVTVLSSYNSTFFHKTVSSLKYVLMKKREGRCSFLLPVWHTKYAVLYERMTHYGDHKNGANLDGRNDTSMSL